MELINKCWGELGTVSVGRFRVVFGRVGGFVTIFRLVDSGWRFRIAVAPVAQIHRRLRDAGVQ